MFEDKTLLRNIGKLYNELYGLKSSRTEYSANPIWEIPSSKILFCCPKEIIDFSNGWLIDWLIDISSIKILSKTTNKAAEKAIIG